ncbi:MAG: phosphoribosylformylglycinamidine synthase subunit PurL [Candidatus Odinarchaeota archaeon]
MPVIDGVKVNLTEEEVEKVKKMLGREPNQVEAGMIDVMWSEHCSYKSSKPFLKQLPREGPRVVVGPGMDAGVIDINDGDVAVFKVETHNHPSAIEPYNGAATGIGGIVRDVLCMGARPVALFNNLRFGELTSNHSKWLFEYVVKGISDYGNCIGVPTVGGDVEFDDSYENNCLVNVGCLGFAKRSDIALSVAENVGDVLILMGGSTGRDGIHGVTFASRVLTEESEADRPAVQIGDPFTKKLIIEATLEAVKTGYVSGLKDLGGGGLTCASSEMSGAGGTGVQIDLNKILLREDNMIPYEIMISESQERMLFVVKPEGVDKVTRIFDKYEVPYSIIGRINHTQKVNVYKNGCLVAQVPSKMLSDPPVLNRPIRRPAYIDKLADLNPPAMPENLADVVYKLAGSPNLASKAWVYRQYDHEVGDRTVVKPGQADAAVLRVIGRNKAVAAKSDATPSHSYLDPYNGGAGALAESCRNVAVTGAEPLAWVDCLSFGNPENPEVLWCFNETIKGLTDYALKLGIPCIGGNVSFYNEDQVSARVVKPCPVVLTVGLIENLSYITTMSFKQAGDIILMVGLTHREMGGSEYYNFYHKLQGGKAPVVNLEREAVTLKSVLKAVRTGKLSAAHDCFRGGIAISLVEMGMENNLSATVNLDGLGEPELRFDEILFSESHGRYILTVKKENVGSIIEIFKKDNIPVKNIGQVTDSGRFEFKYKMSRISCSTRRLRKLYYETIPRYMGVSKWMT